MGEVGHILGEATWRCATPQATTSLGAFAAAAALPARLSEFSPAPRSTGPTVTVGLVHRSWRFETDPMGQEGRHVSPSRPRWSYSAPTNPARDEATRGGESAGGGSSSGY